MRAHRCAPVRDRVPAPDVPPGSALPGRRASRSRLPSCSGSGAKTFEALAPCVGYGDGRERIVVDGDGLDGGARAQHVIGHTVELVAQSAVSYTHLTLPTSDL